MSKKSTIALALLSLVATSSCQQVNWNPDPAWEKAPVSFDWSGIDPTFDSAMKSDLAAWNYAAGCKVAVRAKDAASANVVISAYDGTMCGGSSPNDLDTTPGAVGGHSRCSPIRAEIKFREMSDIRSVFVIGLHEMGHALGLAHHDRSEVMNPSPQLYHPEAFGGGGSARMPMISDWEGAAIGKRYCRK